MIVGHLRGHPRVRAPWTPPGYASYARRFPALFPRSQGQRESSSPGAGARLQRGRPHHLQVHDPLEQRFAGVSQLVRPGACCAFRHGPGDDEAADQDPAEIDEAVNAMLAE